MSHWNNFPACSFMTDFEIVVVQNERARLERERLEQEQMNAQPQDHLQDHPLSLRPPPAHSLSPLAPSAGESLRGPLMMQNPQQSGPGARERAEARRAALAPAARRLREQARRPHGADQKYGGGSFRGAQRPAGGGGSLEHAAGNRKHAVRRGAAVAVVAGAVGP